MSSFPCLVRFVSGSGQVRYRLGERLVDRYLEFVAGRCRPSTLRAVAFDLKSFFLVVRKSPVEVTAADVFEFLADQRGDRTVVRLADRGVGAVGADDRPPPVVGVGPVCLPGGAG
jgi:integrase/recombinase XerD